MDPAEHNESPAEEKKSDNPEHINIKVLLLPSLLYSQIISNPRRSLMRYELLPLQA